MFPQPTGGLGRALMFRSVRSFNILPGSHRDYRAGKGEGGGGGGLGGARVPQLFFKLQRVSMKVSCASSPLPLIQISSH